MAPNWEIVAIVIAGISTLFAGLAILFSFLMWRRTSRVNREEEIEWKVRVDTRLEAVGKRLETMGREIGNNGRRLETVDRRLERNANELNQLRQIVFAHLGVPVIITDSPLRLLEFGKSVSEDIAASEWAEKLAGTLKETVEGKDAYEIQTFCFEYLKNPDQYSNEERKTIHNAAYKRGIMAEEVRRVLAIELRDRLLKNAGLEVQKESQET